jgi:NhaP-type Na+/H+ or K+/H+ antiporter
MFLTTSLALTLIMLLAIACQWLAWRLKLPAILFLLACGIICGPLSIFAFNTAVFSPVEIFGNDLFYSVVSLSVSIILFEGCMTLHFSEIKGSGNVVRNFVTIGLVLTAIATAILSHFILGFPWQVAAMLGAIACVSGPTVVVPMLRSIRPNKEISKIVRWEGMLVDPLGAVFAVIVFAAISSANQFDAVTSIVWHVLAISFIGIAVGIIAGYILGLVLRRHWVPDYMANLFVLSTVVFTFGLVDNILDGSGLLAVTIMGIMVGNMKNTNIDDIVDFKENLSILLISVLFITLGANVTFTGFQDVIFPAILLVLCLQCIVRPIVSLICTFGSNLNWRERALLGWIAPRGIIAASVAAIFSIEIMGIKDPNVDYQLYGRLLSTVTFLIIIGTVLIESFTAPTFAKILKVDMPDPKGFLIIGANKLARKIAKVLTMQNISVQMADVNWKDVQLAKLDGLNCYYGSPSSEHASWHMDLVGIGRMLGLADNNHMNSLAAVRYHKEFGNNTIFILPTPSNSKHTKVINKHYSKPLFTPDLSYENLALKAGDDVTVKVTNLTEKYNWKEYTEANKDKSIYLFAIDTKGKARVFSPDTYFTPSDGWKIISLTIAVCDFN